MIAYNYFSNTEPHCPFYGELINLVGGLYENILK